MTGGFRRVAEAQGEFSKQNLKKRYRFRICWEAFEYFCNRRSAKPPLRSGGRQCR